MLWGKCFVSTEQGVLYKSKFKYLHFNYIVKGKGEKATEPAYRKPCYQRRNGNTVIIYRNINFIYNKVEVQLVFENSFSDVGGMKSTICSVDVYTVSGFYLLLLRNIFH